MTVSSRPIGVAVVGAGYWGPNLIRNFRNSRDFELLVVCDLDVERAAHAVGDAMVRVTDDLQSVLADEAIEAIAIATPAHTHEAIAVAALRAGKHVVVEKPLADTLERGETMARVAREQDRVLMADHTYCYTPAVMKIQELIAEGSLGKLLFVDSVRINLGLVQPDVDVLWDLAPHDLSVFDYILPGGLQPLSVAAHGADPLGVGRPCVGYLTLPLEDDALAHVHVNWMSPTKLRQMVIGGTSRTIVWDDLNPYQRVTVYDRGVDVIDPPVGRQRRDAGIAYRLGDAWAPALPDREALASMVGAFAANIRDGIPSPTGADAALRVLNVLTAAQRSLTGGGAAVALPGRVGISA